MPKDFFDVPDDLRCRIEPLLPPEQLRPKGGRPRVPDASRSLGSSTAFARAVSGRRCPPTSARGRRARCG